MPSGRDIPDHSVDPFADLSSEWALLVVGSLSTKPQDRTHDRADIEPVHAVCATTVDPVPFFTDIGESGVSSLAFDNDAKRLWFSTGTDLVEIDLATGTVKDTAIEGLCDVHEITSIDHELLIANSGRDEIVVFSIAKNRVTERIDLRKLLVASPAGVAEAAVGDVEGADSVDLYHVNQLVVDATGNRLALVHHVGGRQFLRSVATRMIKAQGDGGVIDLADRRAIGLRLTAPHSLVIVGDEYWVFDSGRCQARIYTSEWSLSGEVPTTGWGRGATLGPDRRTLFAGMSPIRKRYLGVVDGPPPESPNIVEALDTKERRSLGSRTIPDIEQINNVYLVPSTIAERLRELVP